MPEKPKKETAVIYCRQSFTHDSDLKSIADQIKKANEYAHQHNIHILTTPFIDEDTSSELYPDTEECRQIAVRDKTFLTWLSQNKRYANVRGKKQIPYKKKLGKCFEFISQNKPTYLIVWSFERLGRSEMSSCLQPCITDFLAFNNCKLIETKNGTITDYNNPNDQLISLIKAHIEYESLKTKKRSSENVIRNRINASRVVTNAYGTITNKRDKTIHFLPEKAKVIRYIYDSIISGKTYAEILFNLNTIFHKNRTKGAKCFYESSIYNIATNPVYCGLMRYAEDGTIKLKPAKNIVDPIISIDLYYAVQKNMELRKNRSGKARYNTPFSERKILPLSGMLFCGNCGGKLTVIYDDGKTFYRCCKYDILHNDKCRESRIRVDFEDGRSGLYDTVKKLFIISFINEMRSKYDIKQKTAEAAKIQTEIENEKQKFKAIFEQIKENKSLDFMQESIKKWSEEIHEKNEKLREIQAKNRIDQNKLEKEVNSLYFQLENNEKIEEGLFYNLARKTLEKIVVYGDHITIQLKDGNEFNLPRIPGKHLSKSLPNSYIKVEKVKGNGKYMIDWVKRFHLHFGDGKNRKILLSTRKYVIYLHYD